MSASTFGASSLLASASRSTACGDADGGIVELRLAVGRRRPEQRDRLRRVADIIAAHPEQDRIDRLLDQAADRRRLHMRDVERAGQRRERNAAVGVRRFLEIVADQLELGVARARVDEAVEKLGESAHRASQCANGRCGAETCLVEPQRESGEDRVRVGAAIARQSLVHMFEAALQRDAVAGQERQLRRTMREAFQSGEAVDRPRPRGSRPSAHGCRAATAARPAC